MATKRSSSPTGNDAQTVPLGQNESSFSEWIAGAMEQGVKPEQALAVVGLGLMRGMGSSGFDLPVLDADVIEADGAVAVGPLKERLEAISLAIQLGAPLTTQEVTLLLGARPGRSNVRRAGVVAERISRNVWQLSRSGSDERPAVSPTFSEGFRRRL